MLRRLLVGAFASVALVSVSRAECVSVTAKEVMSRPGIELVFGGRVVDLQDVGPTGARVTFDVQRVWKGSVPARINLYFNRWAPERPRFTKGTYAIALATTLHDAEMRRLDGMPENTNPAAYAAIGCTDALEKNFEANLGASHPPKQPATLGR